MGTGRPRKNLSAGVAPATGTAGACGRGAGAVVALTRGAQMSRISSIAVIRATASGPGFFVPPERRKVSTKSFMLPLAVLPSAKRLTPGPFGSSCAPENLLSVPLKPRGTSPLIVGERRMEAGLLTLGRPLASKGVAVLSG